MAGNLDEIHGSMDVHWAKNLVSRALAEGAPISAAYLETKQGRLLELRRECRLNEEEFKLSPFLYTIR